MNTPEKSRKKCQKNDPLRKSRFIRLKCAKKISKNNKKQFARNHQNAYPKHKTIKNK